MKKVIGITGGIASGKSTITNYLINNGYKVIDADKIAYQIALPGGAAYLKLKGAFNEYFKDGLLDRGLLGKAIFNDDSKRNLLNNIMHPIIKDEIIKEINKSNDIVFIDVPLLYETGFDKLCDYVIVVYVDLDIQINRLKNRDKIDTSYAKAKIDSQMSLSKKKELCDFIVDNSGSIEDSINSLKDILERIK